MSTLEFSFVLVAAASVLSYCITLVAHLDRKGWGGRLHEFTLFSAAIALLGGGAVGVLLGWVHAPTMLIVGIAGIITMDRRRGIMK